MTTNVVVDNQRLITKVYFPRLILPISTALSGLVISSASLFSPSSFSAMKSSPRSPRFGCPSSYSSPSSQIWALACGSLRSTLFIATSATSSPSSSSLFASPVAYPASLVPSRWRWLY